MRSFLLWKSPLAQSSLLKESITYELAGWDCFSSVLAPRVCGVLHLI